MKTEIQPYESGSEKALSSANDSGAVAAMARERFEIEGSMMLAKRFPREEEDCRKTIFQACGRPTLAETALYEFPRGDETVIGANVRLAREMARIWGNIRCGFRVMATDTEAQEAHVQGFAFDTQTNAYRCEEARVRTRVYRRSTGWIDLLGDDALGGDTERQLGEVIGRAGAKLERNCVLRLLPADLVDEAVEQVKITQAKGVDPEALREVVRYFGARGVSPQQIEAVIGKEVRSATKEDIASLRRVAQTIREGTATIEEVFGSAAEATREVVVEEPAEGGLDHAPPPESSPPPEKEPEPEPESDSTTAADAPETPAAEDPSSTSPVTRTSSFAPEPLWKTHRTAKNSPMKKNLTIGDQWECEKYPGRTAVWDGKKWVLEAGVGAQGRADALSRSLVGAPEEEAPSASAPSNEEPKPDIAGPYNDAKEVFAVAPPEPGLPGQVWINTGTGEVYRHDGDTFQVDNATKMEITTRLGNDLGGAALARGLTKERFLDITEELVGQRPTGIFDLQPHEMQEVLTEILKLPEKADD